MINTIILGHALNVLPQLPAESVNCVVTSPPYWSLRDYGVDPVIWDGDENCQHDFDNIQRYHPTRGKRDGKGIYKDPKWEAKGSLKKEVDSNFCKICGAWRGSLGLEPTFELYIKHLCNIFDDVKRVLRKDGTCWVNLGDSYGGSGGDSGKTIGNQRKGLHGIDTRPVGISGLEGNQKLTKGYEKSLLDIPYRFSIEMINRGWIKRNTIIWWKPNCMPSSADDRFTVDFEYLFFFTKNNKAIFWTNEKTLECVSKNPPGIKGIAGKDWRWGINSKGKPKKISFWTGHDYWFEQQFEEFLSNDYDRNRMANARTEYGGKWAQDSGGSIKTQRAFVDGYAQGRNKRCVWIIPTQPFPEAHFAVYPEGLIEIPIRAGCPEFICKKCGKARVKIYKTIGKQITKSMRIAGCNEEGKYNGTEQKDYDSALAQNPSETKKRILESMSQIKESYLTDCGCNTGWESGIVLDPFIGSGTTAKEALRQRKRFIGIDIKQEYVDMSYRKIANVQQNIF